MNRLITSKEIESAIKILPIKKNTRPDGFMGEFYETFFFKIIYLFISERERERTSMSGGGGGAGQGGRRGG